MIIRTWPMREQLATNEDLPVSLPLKLLSQDYPTIQEQTRLGHQVSMIHHVWPWQACHANQNYQNARDQLLKLCRVSDVRLLIQHVVHKDFYHSRCMNQLF